MTMAALVEVLKLFRRPEQLIQTHPTIRYLARCQEEIAAAANELQPILQEALAGIATVNTVVTSSQIGSGALPIDQLPSQALEITPVEPGDPALQKIVQAFRKLPLPVIGRIQGGKLLFDLRTLDKPLTFKTQLGHLNLT